MDTKASQVAHHYNSRKDTGRIFQRSDSDAPHTRKLHNWIKSVLYDIAVKEVSPCSPLVVLDLACGKGGDLGKVARLSHPVGAYVGVDIASVSVSHAIERYCDFNVSHQTFGARFVVADCFDPQTDLLQHIAHALQVPYAHSQFDLVSCQFALHYSFESEQRAKTALKNISSCLREGGIFFGTTLDANVIVRKITKAIHENQKETGNRYYKIEWENADSFAPIPKSSPFHIEYYFTLDSSVEKCPEYLLPISTLEKLARQVDLELVSADNFHRFVYKYSQNHLYPKYYQLLRSMKVLDHEGTIPSAQWDLSYCYTTFMFRKINRNSSRPRSSLELPFNRNQARKIIR